MRLWDFVFGLSKRKSTAEDAECAENEPGLFLGSLRPLRTRR